VAGPGETIAPDRLLVRFRSGASAAQEAQVRHSMGATLARSYHLVPGLELLTTSSTRSALDTVAALSHDPDVRYATPDVVYHVQAMPDDPLYSQQWGMESIGAPEAWDRSTGSSSDIVAVLDTGITLNHPDLEANIWTNPNPGQDGYVDDVHGWNFVSNNNNPTDDYGHGTHVAGIIGAVGNNGLGVTGVNWSVSLMPLKICNAEGSCFLSDEIAALEYAVNHGAKVANASFGGDYGGYQPEEEAIQAAGKAGLLYVAAAGNSASDNDDTPFYPASYPLENIVSVAATTSSNTLASFSDYGLSSVELGAPGQSILSTLPTSGPLSSSTGYGELSGTSMATPQVSGAAALLWSLHPSWTMQQIRSRLLATVRPLPSLIGKVSTCGELDVGVATAPGPPERASVCVTRIGTGSGSVTSSPAGIDCGASCSATFAPGTQVTLTATPEAGSTFEGWRGACTGTGSCTVSLTTGASVTAIFGGSSGTPAGWAEEWLAAPSQREPFAPGSSSERSFYNVSLSASGSVRAKTIYNPDASCAYATSNTGGVFLEERTPAGWVSDGSLTAPAVGSDLGARWANCSSYGSVTELSGDGSTLLVSPEMGSTYNPELGSRYRCAAFVYRHGSAGWALDGTLFPPGIGVTGSATWEGCDYFGIGGAISDDGTRVAVLSGRRVDVFLREASGWSLEQHIVLPEGSGCNYAIGPRQIALAGDGATLLVSQPYCETSGHTESGRVYAYTRSGSAWSLAQTIESPEAQSQNEFGSSIAISDDGSTAAISVGRRSTGLGLWAGATWILKHDEGGWHVGTRLTAPTPEENASFNCPTIIESGARIICGASDTVGLNSRQGSIYLFERPAAGWTSSGPPVRLFARDGAARDGLGTVGQLRWKAFAASADGSLIDATISPFNLANGTYPDNRMGYEFGPATSFPLTITHLSPLSGVIGSSVTITGTNFAGASAVSFNGTQAGSYTVDSATQITATVPAGASTGPISVTTPLGTATSSENFMAASPPTITGFSPPSGATGSSVTITGTNLTGASAVSFNGTQASSYSVESATQITAVVPPGATTGAISVTTAGGTATSSNDFTVVPSPTIAGLSPPSGVIGSSVTITGTNLTGASAVSFHGTEASSYTVESTTQIAATVPAGATTGPISVTTAGGTATSSENFTVVPSPPTITGFSPPSGLIGSRVVIRGTNLTGASAVSFNGTQASSYLVEAPTQIVATVPAGATTGAISVTTAGGTATSSEDFTVKPPPTITGFSPESGLIGSPVAITGTNLTGASAVSFNGTQASSYTVESSTKITATVPASATTGPITIATANGSATSTEAFIVRPWLETTASGPAVVGEKIHDTATLSVYWSTKAKMNFQLYASSDQECVKPILPRPVTTPVDKGNGTYESPAVTMRTPGSYQWVVTYRYDDNAASLIGSCNDAKERVLVKAKPSLTTSASGTILAGEEIHDTAALSRASSPTGAISFQLYSSSDRECATPIGPPVTTEVDRGEGSYESPAIIEYTPGSYQWVASYSGDENNAAVTTKCNHAKERVLVKGPVADRIGPAGSMTSGLDTIAAALSTINGVN